VILLILLIWLILLILLIWLMPLLLDQSIID
jgi:hypothetical protein